MAVEGQIKASFLVVYDLASYVQAVCLALLGGSVSYFATTTLDAVKLHAFLIHVMGSGFAGVMAMFVCDYSGLHGAAAAFVIGAAGYMGPKTLIRLAMRSRTLKTVFDNTQQKDTSQEKL